MRSYTAGEVVIRAGDAGEFLFTICSGTVAVQWNSSSDTTTIVMGPGEIFGEMSLISASATSATIVALTAADIFLTPSSTFHKLLAEDSEFLRVMLGVLTRRLRVRTSQDHQVPICAFIALPTGYVGDFPKAIRRAVDRYVRVVSLSDRIADPDAISSMKTAIDHWRALHSDGVYIVFVAYAELSRLRDKMRDGDVVLIVETDDRMANIASDCVPTKVDVATVRSGGAINRPAQSDEAWSFSVSDADIRTMVNEPYAPVAPPPIDILARWILKRCVGVALGAGGAKGFAHLGVLRALENAGITLDFLAGSSIGGIISLFYGMTASATEAFELTRESVGSNRIVREVAWLPRTSLFGGRRLRQRAERVSGGLMVRDLKRSALTLATDLISGKGFLIDRGPIAIALQATSAIPGIFPAIIHEGKCLVDGGLTSRIPVHLLGHGRCGLKIAVSIEPGDEAEDEKTRTSLLRDLSNSFSIGRVIARSWDLMGISQGQVESDLADFVIRPRFSGQSGFNFDAIEPFAHAGEIAAHESVTAIQSRVTILTKTRDGWPIGM
jgi:NTE family protein